MKNSNLRNILILVGVAILVAYFQWQEGREKQTPQASNTLVLAISWQPTFCEFRPNKPECRSQRDGRFDTRNFSLHGLWPQPRDNLYCNVPDNLVRVDKSGRWQDLPKLELSGKLRTELAEKMPGYRSNLHRHEWYKHGTCIEDGTPEQYFNISLQLLASINSSPLPTLFANNIGREITSTQIINAFESAYGKGLGNRLSISCKRDEGRNLINELKISLATEGERKDSLSEIFEAAPALPIDCKQGIVDPVGLQ